MEYLQQVDESFFNRMMGKLADGSPIPSDWSPEEKATYWGAYKKVASTPGMNTQAAHKDAINTVMANRKMAGWRAAAATATPAVQQHVNPYNTGPGKAFDGTMPAKDMTSRITGQ